MTDRLGDFGVVATRGFVPWMIRLVTRSTVNHAVLAVGNGQIVEGEPGGALLSPDDRYAGAIHWANWPLTDEQRDTIAAWGRAHVGVPYSWVDDAEIGMVDVFHWAPRWMRKRLRSSRTLMCSQLVDAAYNAAGVELFTDGRPAGGVSPQDLYALMGVAA